ncbi:MAG TPA: DUF5668 domain-containing protein [Dongiaceae bacterium]|nr:DUF5668 domain-containing protein [Dongiaceae bacterium]
MDSGEKFRQNLEDQIRSRVDRDLMRKSQADPYTGMIPGVVILALGAIFLLSNLGVINGAHFWQFWPVILILAGAARLADPCRRNWGVILIVLGVLLQLNGLGIAHFNWNTLWPILLICAGAMAIWSALQARRVTEKLGATGDPRSTVNEQAIFGGIEKRLNGREFRGGQLQSLFGGIELDLRDAEMAESESVIYANAVFGGIEVRVPEHWYVVARGQGIFGGFSDNTRYVAPGTPSGEKPQKTLIVMGSAVFGGVEIRN